MWIPFLFAILPSPVTAETTALSTSVVGPPRDIGGSEKRATSPNFQVNSTALDAREVAALCENARCDLVRTWSVESSLAVWSPHCEVVVHSTRTSYCAA